VFVSFLFKGAVVVVIVW